jgi:hypothetical protein
MQDLQRTYALPPIAAPAGGTWAFVFSPPKAHHQFADAHKGKVQKKHRIHCIRRRQKIRASACRAAARRRRSR